VTPYWYHADSDTTTFQEPPELVGAKSSTDPDPEEPQLPEGPAGQLDIKELREALKTLTPAELESQGLTDQALAQRAVYEYEVFTPRVLSWHDYQYNTFWFFIGDRDKKRGGKQNGFFNNGKPERMFAHDGFFHATADEVQKRLHRIHPINLVYLLWSYVRAGVHAPEFFAVCGDYFCDGLLPSLDRCGLGTIIWAYSKARIRHKRLFTESAEELSRLVRTRSLAPRNFQNSLLAYGWWKRDTQVLVERFASQIPRLLDNHDTWSPKHRAEVCFPYTCKDGARVDADSFRVSSLSIIGRIILDLHPRSCPEVQECMESMVRYTKRTVAETHKGPGWLREKDDVVKFATVLAHAAAGRSPHMRSLVEELEAADIISDRASEQELGKFERARSRMLR